MNGCKRDHLESYIDELLWRERHTVNTFNDFLNEIKNQYKII